MFKNQRRDEALKHLNFNRRLSAIVIISTFIPTLAFVSTPKDSFLKANPHDVKASVETASIVDSPNVTNGYLSVQQGVNLVATTPEPKVNLNIKSKPVQPKVHWKKGYSNSRCNIRKNPSTKSKIIDTINVNTKIVYAKYNSSWNYIKYRNKVRYLAKNLVSKNKLHYRSYYVHSSGFKSYMPYTAITYHGGREYRLQHSYAYTGNYGIRQVNNRYCIAVGSAAHASIGSYIDLILHNGTVIKCISGDTKANRDTKSDNLTTADNGCVSEFLISSSQLDGNARRYGDISYCCNAWRSPVREIRVYKQNVFR